VIYDRANSAMASCKPRDFIWDKIFAGASWFHVTGITPAISQGAADATTAALKAAKKVGLVTSCDLNYRAKLWKYGKAAPDVMRGLLPLVDVVIANEEDIQTALGIALDQKIGGAVLSQEKYAHLTLQVMHEFPNLEVVAVTLRESHSADHNTWGAMCRLKDQAQPFFSKKYDLTHIVDRVGAGDAFAAGLIYSYLKQMNPVEALEFAVAASALKHTFAGDFNMATVDEVKALVAGEVSGRVQR
jgi:2-dehydro-3-deoxygluconokinase